MTHLWTILMVIGAIFVALGLPWVAIIFFAGAALAALSNVGR